jgi:hypothetical protein
VQIPVAIPTKCQKVIKGVSTSMAPEFYMVGRQRSSVIATAAMPFIPLIHFLGPTAHSPHAATLCFNE